MHNPHDPQVLPIRQGIKPSCVVFPTHTNGMPMLALDYLVQRLPVVSRHNWLRRMAAGDVMDEYARPVQPDTPFLAGLRVYYYREVIQEASVPFAADVLYQDAHIVVADKPHFLPVVPGGHYLQNTLLVRLRNQLKLPELSPVHRIDRDTAGLVLFAVRRSDRGAYQALFRERHMGKTYEAIAAYRANLSFPRTHSSRMRACPTASPICNCWNTTHTGDVICYILSVASAISCVFIWPHWVWVSRAMACTPPCAVGANATVHRPFDRAAAQIPITAQFGCPTA